MVRQNDIIKEIINCIIIILIFCGCTNQYEIAAKGKYKISSIEKGGVENYNNKDTSILLLNDRNEFSLSFKNRTLVGSWNANDNGDITWIKLVDKNGIAINGQIGDSIVILYPPLTFVSNDVTKMVYHKLL